MMDHNNTVYLSTNFMWFGSAPTDEMGTLGGIAQTDWLRDRIPARTAISDPALKGIDRHRDAVNIAFSDGHGASVGANDWKKVRVSPLEF